MEEFTFRFSMMVWRGKGDEKIKNNKDFVSITGTKEEIEKNVIFHLKKILSKFEEKT
jgi:hypothetical protein